jgi:hypothetical protein
MNDESTPKGAPETAAKQSSASVAQAGDVVRLPHQLVALYFRDAAARSRRRYQAHRGHHLDAEQAKAYRIWLDQQCQAAS